MNEWISVNDELPKTAYWVLVTNGVGVTMGEWDVCDWETTSRHIKEVTHWMELPLPPEGK